MGKWFKRTAWMAGLFVGSMVLLYTAAWAKTESDLSKRYVIADAPLQFSGDAEERARGEHLFNVIGCVDCHGKGGIGRVFIDAGPVARIIAPNLTPAALGSRYTNDQLAAAIRHGVGPDGRPLRVMPAADFMKLSDADTAALITHMRALPDSGNDPGQTEIRPLGKVLHLLGRLDLVPAAHIDHSPRVRAAPARAATADYGAYLAQVCTGCHGTDWAGQHVPGTPPELPDAANLTPHPNGLHGWTETDFLRAMREGVRPDKSELHPFMPWRTYSAMTDDELRAIWLHLAALPPAPGKGKAKG